jgi:hypothetical protein|tara:strand:- start:63 stop:584 length:522 start_codon:yes stop_codon:yes gene_type:complete
VLRGVDYSPPERRSSLVVATGTGAAFVLKVTVLRVVEMIQCTRSYVCAGSNDHERAIADSHFAEKWELANGARTALHTNTSVTARKTRFFFHTLRRKRVRCARTQDFLLPPHPVILCVNERSRRSASGLSVLIVGDHRGADVTDDVAMLEGTTVRGPKERLALRALAAERADL